MQSEPFLDRCLSNDPGDRRERGKEGRLRQKEFKLDPLRSS